MISIFSELIKTVVRTGHGMHLEEAVQQAEQNWYTAQQQIILPMPLTLANNLAHINY